MLLSLLGSWPGQLDEFGHFESDFVFDDFEQSDIRSAEIAGFGNQRTAHRAGAGVELTDAAGNQVDQNVGVSNLLQGFFS